MISLISQDRLEKPGGLWTTKTGGIFMEGNPTSTGFFIDGKVEIKELGGHLKIFFKAIKLTPRTLQITEEKKAAEDDESDDSDDDANNKKTIVPAESLTKLPKLQVFMTTKKPKRRMVDAHKTGTKIKIPQLTDGEFGALNEERNYDAVLVDILDVLSYQGVVVVKLPHDEPPTDEPIVFGYVRLQSSRSIRIRSMDALHLSEMADMHAKLVLKEEMAGRIELLGPTAKKSLKPLHVYRSLAAKAWSSTGKGPEDTVEFDELMKILDHMDLFFLSYQARRIFDAVDVKREGRLGLSEFENFLIAKDLLASYSKDLVVMDVYDALKAPPVELPGAENSPQKKSKFKREQIGMHYSAFVEALELLGTVEVTADDIQAAFCYGGDCKPRDADFKLLTLPEFRKGWLKLANIEAEMEARRLKTDGGMFAESRNRERVSRFIVEREELYLRSLGAVNAFVEQMKADHRKHKDEVRREKEANREKLLHEANKFIAERSQEKRLKLKKEQEERSKKRLEDKVLRNKLLLRQQENANLKRAEIAQQNAENERLRQNEIRTLGLDKMDISVRELRKLPLEMYKGKDAQTKLTYVVLADWSHNMIEEIPADLVFYWMNDTRKLKLSQNRLRRLPNDLGDMARLEILELDSNRLECLPDSLGELSNLQRLNVANNQLTGLPESLGKCSALKYINAHSNHLQFLPMSLGGCFKLQFLDASRNQLHELPEDMQYLVSLTHLDLSGNRLGHLPHNIGNCQALQYLDLSENLLAALPRSFGQLTQLEYCNFENNSIISAVGCLTQLHLVKYCNFKRNALSEIGIDVGALRNVTYLDFSLNQLNVLPVEIGLLTALQELRLSRNQLTAIPPELGACTALAVLDLTHNAITGGLPEQLSLTRSLRELHIAFNEVDALPESIVGFQEMIRFNAERCHLRAFPGSFVHLDTLEVVEVPNNHFTRFPIELHAMKRLRILNLYNNAIALLPRSIHLMQSLEELNLGRNQLQALPVEFVEVLESVPTVHLQENPWTLLPEKWGRRRNGKHASDAPLGYTLTDAMEFLYSMRVLYDTVEQIWFEYGVFYCTHRLSFEDYLQEIRQRLPATWHEGLVEYAQHLFFASKATGLFVRWYELSEAQQADTDRKILIAEAKHQAQIEQSKADILRRTAKAERAYHQDIFRRMRQAADQLTEHARGEEYMEVLQAKALHDNLRYTGKRMQRRLVKRQVALLEQQRHEVNRAMDILREDRPVRDAELAYQKTVAVAARAKETNGVLGYVDPVTGERRANKPAVSLLSATTSSSVVSSSPQKQQVLKSKSQVDMTKG